MGRPRKQPRRIVTFNLNADLAQRIDDLNLSNRSEWANGVFREVMDDRLAQRQGQQLEDIANAEELARQDLLDNLANEPKRMAAMLVAYLDRQGLEDYKPVGRYSLRDLLVRAINDTSYDGFMGR